LFLVFIGIAGFFLFRMLQSRKENPAYEEPPRRMTRREKKLAQLEAFDDDIPPRPTIQELVAEEIRATGVDRIPGSEGIESPVLLKVWHRDEHVRSGCAAGALRYVVREGVSAATAQEADVMLVCDEVVGKQDDAPRPAILDEPPGATSSEPWSGGDPGLPRSDSTTAEPN
jgi:hypothetical protein